MKLKIGIVGTRGIPNQYGGFEQFAEYLSQALARKGHNVYVYSSHKHTYQKKKWNDVHIIHCYDPEYKIGTAGQFIYDFNCIRDTHKRGFDAILILGYTSSSIWGPIYPKKSAILINMDGLEWKRSKYSDTVKRFLRHAEKLAVKYSSYLIADSLGIQEYLQKKYGAASEFIPYGAEIINDHNEQILTKFSISKYNYYMLMARMEPENNIEMILDGFHDSDTDKRIIVVGNYSNKFGSYLIDKFKNDPRIVFTGAIYDNFVVHSLKFYSYMYFHGHSVGGTNPSLLEAMASQALIAAHENSFNTTVLEQDAYYFSTAENIINLINNKIRRNETEVKMIANNLKKIEDQYNWNRIVDQYESYIINCVKKEGLQ